MKDCGAGYKGGKKQWDQMLADGGRVTVKSYARGGAVKKAFPKAPPKPTPVEKDVPKSPQMAKGGKINIKPENKGKLHKALGVPADKKIPEAKLAKAAKSSNPVLKKRAVFAENAKSFDHKSKGGKVKMKKEKC